MTNIKRISWSRLLGWRLADGRAGFPVAGAVLAAAALFPASAMAAPTSISASVLPVSVTEGDGSMLAFSADVSASSPLLGTVTFFDGGLPISNCVNAPVDPQMGTASCQTLNDPQFFFSGTHSITAEFSGDQGNDPSTSVAVDLTVLPVGGGQQQPQGSITTTMLAASAASVAEGGTVTFKATVGGGAAPGGIVAFLLDGPFPIAGCDSVAVVNAVAVCTASGLAVGNHLVVADYSGDQNNLPSLSNPLPVVVAAADGGGNNGGGIPLPSGGGAISIEGKGNTVKVTESGGSGSGIKMAPGSQVNVNLPTTGVVKVSAETSAKVEVMKAYVKGEYVDVLDVAAGQVEVTATKAGQATVCAKGVTLVAAEEGRVGKVRVDASGKARLEADAGDSIVVGSEQVSTDAMVDLKGAVDIQIGAESLEVMPVEANTTIAFDAVEVDKVPVQLPTVVSGEVEVVSPGDCVPMLSVKKTPIASGEKDSKARLKQDDGGYTVTFTEGRGLIGLCAAGNRMAQEVKPVYAGESAEFDSTGLVQRIRLGSRKRDLEWTGDRLALTGFVPTSYLRGAVTDIRGRSSRLQQDFATAVLAAVNTGTGHQWDYQSVKRDTGTGVWTVRAQHATGANDYLAVWPVGDVVVEEGPDTIRTSANGTVQVRTGNLLADFVPALMDPQGFAAQVKADGADEVVFQPDGTLHIAFGPQIYVWQPDWEVYPGSEYGFGTDFFGRVTWTDKAGNIQSLDPAFADLSQVLDTLRGRDPGLVFSWAWRGEVSIVYQGVPMILVPDNVLAPTPPAHKNELLWEDGNKSYVRYPNYSSGGRKDFSQGYQVRLP